MIFALGGGISIYEGIRHILHPEPLRNPIINYIVLTLALLFEGAAWYLAFREFSHTKGKWGYIDAVKRGKDPSLFVVLFEDSAAMLGLLVAFIGVVLTQYTGILYFDGLASVLIGVILVSTADKIEKTIAELDKTIKAQQPQIKRIFIEAEKISSIKTRTS